MVQEEAEAEEPVYTLDCKGSAKKIDKIVVTYRGDARVLLDGEREGAPQEAADAKLADAKKARADQPTGAGGAR